MELTSSSLSPLTGIHHHHHHRHTFPATTVLHSFTKKPMSSLKLIKASNGDRFHGSSGELVDKNMVVLRKCIYEMKLSEMIPEPPPAEWMEWEKKYYNARYGSDICHALGLVQLMFMNTRPSFAIGMVAMVILSVPIFVVFMLWVAHNIGTSL